MRLVVASIVIGPLMLIGALPEAVGQSSSSGTQTQSAAGSDATADRVTCTQNAREDMQQWQQKLHDFSENAKAKGQRAGNAVENELTAAWDETRAEGTKIASRERGRLGERQILVREGIPRTGRHLGQDSIPGLS